MNPLTELVTDAFAWTLLVSGRASVLACLILVVQRVFRSRLSPAWRHALWYLLLLSLVLPVRPESPASIFQLTRYRPAPPPQDSPPPTVSAPATSPRIEPSSFPFPETPEISRIPNWARPTGTAKPTSPRNTDWPAAAIDLPASDSRFPSSFDPTPSSPPEPRPFGPSIPWSTPLALLWFTGVLLLAGRTVLRDLRFQHRIRQCHPVNDPELLQLLAETAERMGVNARVDLVETREVESPAIFGLWRRRLLLPVGFRERFSVSDLHHIFLHELAHLRRRDLEVHALSVLVQLVHWFNPILAYAFARMRADRELATDALALSRIEPTQDRPYGETLLKVVESIAHPESPGIMLGIGEDKRLLRDRLRLIVAGRNRHHWRFAAAFLAAGLALVSLTDAPSASKIPATAADTAASDAASDDPSSASATPDPASAPSPRVTLVGADPDPALGTNGNRHASSIRRLLVQVVDAQTGAPIPYAEIHSPDPLDPEKPGPRRLADANGRYELTLQTHRIRALLGDLTYSVAVTHTNYARRNLLWAQASEPSTTPDTVTLPMLRGIPVGGVVTDSRGTPLPGVRVLLDGHGPQTEIVLSNGRKSHHGSSVLPDLWPPAQATPHAVTDASGRWTYPQFPPDIDIVTVTLVRPDLSQETFTTSNPNHTLNVRRTVDPADLKRGTATFPLPDGHLVRGIVVDDSGRPLAGATVREGFGHTPVQATGSFATDAEGRFTRPHRQARQWIYTASHPGHATTSVIAEVGPETPEVRIVLPPAQPLRARFTDEQTRPLAGVEVEVFPFRSEGQVLEFSARSDADGRIVWSNAPLSTLSFFAATEDRAILRQFVARGGDPEKTIVLSRRMMDRIRLRLTTVDSATRQPVKVRAVSARQEWAPRPFQAVAEPNAATFEIEFERSNFDTDTYLNLVLRITADGYDDLVTDPIDFALGDQDLTLELVPAGNASFLVLLPDGTPAAGARSWHRQSAFEGPLFIQGFGQFFGDRLQRGTADADGRIPFSGAGEDAAFVVATDRAFAAEDASVIRRTGRLQLQPYAHLTGQLRVNGTPLPGEQVTLASLTFDATRPFAVNLSAITDDQGRFRFTNAPPGEYLLYRWKVPPQTTQRVIRSITSTYQFPIELRPGTNPPVTYDCVGRTLVGRALPDDPSLQVDWQADIHTLTLTVPEVPGSPRPNREDFATFAAYNRANNASLSSDATLRLARLGRTYPLRFEPDGSFVIEAVPPGTYSLQIAVSRPDPPGTPSQTIGRPPLASYSQTVVVTDQPGSLDLGSLVVPFPEDSGLPRPAPLDLTGETFDGSPLRLSELRGQPLVFVLWAQWSSQSRELLARVRSVIQSEPLTSRVTLVTAHLDDDRQAALEFLRESGIAGTALQLEPATRSAWIDQLKLDTIPLLLVVDRAGRVAARDLDSDRLAVALQRLLP